MREKKFYLKYFFIFLLLIIIILMGIWIGKLYNEKIELIIKNEKLQIQVKSFEEARNEFKENNDINATNFSDTNISYKKITESIFNDMLENQYFVIQNVMKNTDDTITLNGRIYEDVELTEISSNEYNALKASGNIILFGEKFILDEYEDFVPGYILKNSNGYGFYVTENYKLIDFNNTNFVKGTDNYYTITIKENVELINNISGVKEKVSETSFVISKNYNFINIDYIYDFEFNNGEVSKIRLNK